MDEANDIEVVEYDPRWPAKFENLAARVSNIVDGVIAVEHVGSTSVPGLAAKPIIDLIVVIASRAALPMMIAALERIGYRYEGDLGIAGREAFRWPRGEDRHHLYVCDRESPELQRQLAFREYLRSEPEERDRYVQLKRQLAGRHRTDRAAYTSGKSEFIERALKSSRGCTRTMRHYVLAEGAT